MINDFEKKFVRIEDVLLERVKTILGHDKKIFPTFVVD
jgi:hypothetical protein